MKANAVRICFFVLCVAAIVVWYVVFTNKAQNRVVFLDVGYGDAIFIETEDGFQVLIDTGPDAQILNELGSILPPWDRSIDLILLTHLHADHIGGLRYVYDTYNIGKILINDQIYDSPITREVKEILDQYSVGMVEGFVAGESVSLPSGFTIGSVWPLSTYNKGDDVNDTAMVVLLNMYGIRLLLTSDVELGRPIFDQLSYEVGDVDILKMPHHGSRVSVSKKALSFLDPEVAVFSVGKNSYGHPDGNVLQLMYHWARKVYRTDQNGRIEIDIDGEGLNYRVVKQYD